MIGLTCIFSGKIQFPTKAEDDAEIKVCRAKAPINPRRREKRCYRCPHCGAWHLTSRPKRVGRRQ
jgi:hypothetical protein